MIVPFLGMHPLKLIKFKVIDNSLLFAGWFSFKLNPLVPIIILFALFNTAIHVNICAPTIFGQA